MKSLQTWPGISTGGFGGFLAAVLCFDPGTGLGRGCTASGATFGVTWMSTMVNIIVHINPIQELVQDS